MNFFCAKCKNLYYKFFEKRITCFFVFKVKMQIIMNYSAGKDQKHLLWTIDEDVILKCNISEFRLCDCFLEWGIAFLKKYSNITLSNDFMRLFFDSIPTETIDCDVYSVFGENCIVCCRDGLYNFFYKDSVEEEIMTEECDCYETDCCCMYFLTKQLFFTHLCNKCQLNFIKGVSKTFKIIKNERFCKNKIQK